MSEPITRTDLRRLANMLSGVMVPIDGTMLAGLIDGVIAHAKSASPPRGPTEAEYTTAREQDRAEGYRAGIEAAAETVNDLLRDGRFNSDGYTALHCAFDDIRALAASPYAAPLPAPPGSDHDGSR